MLAGADRGFNGGTDAIRPVGVEAAFELQFKASVASVLGDFHESFSQNPAIELSGEKGNHKWTRMDTDGHG